MTYKLIQFKKKERILSFNSMCLIKLNVFFSETTLKLHLYHKTLHVLMQQYLLMQKKASFKLTKICWRYLVKEN